MSMHSQPDLSPSVLDRINRVNRLIRDVQDEVNALASMFGIIRPDHPGYPMVIPQSGREETRQPYAQDVPYFTPKAPASDPLFGPLDLGPGSGKLTVNPDEPDGMPRADRFGPDAVPRSDRFGPDGMPHADRP